MVEVEKYGRPVRLMLTELNINCIMSILVISNINSMLCVVKFDCVSPHSKFYVNFALWRRKICSWHLPWLCSSHWRHSAHLWEFSCHEKRLLTYSALWHWKDSSSSVSVCETVLSAEHCTSAATLQTFVSQLVEYSPLVGLTDHLGWTRSLETSN